MKKYILLLPFLAMATMQSAQAQNLYAMGNGFIKLDDFTKADSTALPTTEDADSVAAVAARAQFKLSSKYASRFNVVMPGTDASKTATYKGRTFKLVDANTMTYKITPTGRDINVKINPDEKELAEEAGNQFLLEIADGFILVQMFDGKTGYKVTKYDEWAKPKFKINIEHTDPGGADGMAKPYLYYLTHTDRFLVFSTPTSTVVHKTIVVDLKDGKTQTIESAVCGAIRAENELAYGGYVIKDDVKKTIKVSTKAGAWALKEPEITKVVTDAIMMDTSLVMVRYYRGKPGISLAKFNLATGKVTWVAEMKQPAAAPQVVYISTYNDKLLMEGVQNGGNYLEAFDLNTGKRLYSSF